MWLAELCCLWCGSICAEVLGQHMSMDPVMLDACGDVLAAQFAGVTKVLTGGLSEIPS